MDFFGSAKIYDVKATGDGNFVILENKTEDAIKHEEKPLIIRPNPGEVWTIQVIDQKALSGTNLEAALGRNYLVGGAAFYCAR